MDAAASLAEAAARFDRGDWPGAAAAWRRAGPEALPPDALDRYATAAELLGEHDECARALQSAFRQCCETGDLAGAVHAAFRLAMNFAAHGGQALSAGWVARAEELVTDLEADAVERGWVAFLRMFRHLGAGQFPEAAAAAEQAVRIGRAHGVVDLTVMGTCSRGRMAIYAGRVAEGLAMLDEAMAEVVAGEVSPVIAGHVYCTAIEGCQEICDVVRMAEWTAALETWCSDQPGLLAFTGQCAVHRAQLLRMRGQWSSARAELALAVRRYLEVGSPDAVGLAEYELGELLRLQGGFEDAATAFERAAGRGHDPQPGLALLWLAQGSTTAATAAMTRLLAEPGGPVQRLRILPAAVEVLINAGDEEGARAAADELVSLDAAVDSVGMRARTAQVSGALALAGGDPAGAMPYLRRALQLWTGVGARHDAARVRMLMGRALSSLGDEESARREFTAASQVFRELGAGPDLAAAEQVLAPEALPAGLTEREVEVLRLVASGRSNARIASDLVLSEKTVARHLSNIFAKLDVDSRTAAAAFAYEHHLV